MLENDFDAETKKLLDESESAEYQSNLLKPRLSSKKVKCAWFIGQRGSGKTTAMESDAEKLYNEFITSLYIWASRSNENVFVAVNRNCKHVWKQYFDKIERKIMLATNDERKELHLLKEELNHRLRCDCDKAYPINWLVPEYYDFKGVQEYNYNWSGKEEFDIAYENQWVTRPYQELSVKEKDQLHHRKLPKPKHLVKTDLIRICPFTIPKNAKSKEIFEKQMLEYLFSARREHRWIIMNPLNFLTEQDKFQTISYIIQRIKFWADEYFQPSTPASVAKLRGVKTPVPKEQWTKKEKSWDKMHLLLTELRTIAPTNKYSPQQKSSLSKRELVDIAPELRHFRVYLTGDLQNISDLNDSIKPMANYVIIKRADKKLLGEEYGWFSDLIDKKRNQQLYYLSHKKFDDFAKTWSGYREHFKQIIDQYLPRISELPTNCGYVVYGNGEYKLIQFKMARFHHKTENETLQSVTGITWKINPDKLEVGTTATPFDENDKKSSKRLSDYDSAKVLEWCASEFILLLDWKKVVANLRKKIESTNEHDKLPITGIEVLDHKALSNRVRKDKKFKEVMDFAKKHRDMPKEQLLSRLK